MLPAAERGQDGEVLGAQLVRAGLKHVGHPPLIDEDCGLARTHDKTRPVLDLVLVSRKPPDERVPCVVDPFDDVDQLAAKLAHESHRVPLEWLLREASPPVTPS